MEETVLAKPEVDECCLDTRHHLGNFAKVDVADHFFLVRGLDKKLREPSVLCDGDPCFVGRRVDDDFFLHTVPIVPTFLR